MPGFAFLLDNAFMQDVEEMVAHVLLRFFFVVMVLISYVCTCLHRPWIWHTFPAPGQLGIDWSAQEEPCPWVSLSPVGRNELKISGRSMNSGRCLARESLWQVEGGGEGVDAAASYNQDSEVVLAWGGCSSCPTGRRNFKTLFLGSFLVHSIRFIYSNQESCCCLHYYLLKSNVGRERLLLTCSCWLGIHMPRILPQNVFILYIKRNLSILQKNDISEKSILP